MKAVLLGSAAAEGWPAPFCDCPACARARRLGGRDLRGRSGAWIDDSLKIDASADTVLQAQRLGLSFAGLRSLIVTHDHSDHFIPQELRWLGPPFSTTRADAPPLELWGNARVIVRLEADFADYAPTRVRIKPCRLEPGVAITTASRHRVLPLPAEHCLDALLLRIESPSGGVLFYGHDSGLWPEETWRGLRGGPRLDVVLMDCTNGGAPSDNRGHMGVDGVLAAAERLRAENLLAPSARLVATHFSHNGGLCHAELTAALGPQGVEVAYDGMRLE